MAWRNFLRGLGKVTAIVFGAATVVSSIISKVIEDSDDKRPARDIIRESRSKSYYDSRVQDYDNYILAHHIGDSGKIYHIPMYPKSINDDITSSFKATNVLGRTAPIQAWTGAGPRKVTFTLELHRDMDYDSEGEKITKSNIGDLAFCLV